MTQTQREMIPCQAIINGTTFYISNEKIDLTHPYRNMIMGMLGIYYQLSHNYGGQCKVSATGELQLNPKLFDDNWPPPKQITFIIYHTNDTEENATELFRSTLHKSMITEDGVFYKVKDFQWKTQLLEEIEDYDGNTVPVKRIFGTINYANAFRLPDSTGVTPIYHKSYVTNNIADWFTAVTNNGSGKPRFICSSHPFSTGDVVVIDGANTTFNGNYTITKIDANNFDPTTTQGYASDDNTLGYCFRVEDAKWRVHDDGVPVIVHDNGDGTFSPTVNPVGEITISGTSPYTNLVGVFSWAASKFGNFSIATSNSRLISPQVNCLIDNQEYLIDFLEDLSAFFTHIFYFDHPSSTINIVDCFIDNGTTTMRQIGGHHLEVQYTNNNDDPTASIACEWIERYARELSGGNRFVDDKELTQKISMVEYESGTNTATATNSLISSGASFITNGCTYNMIARCITNDTEANVISISSNTRIELDSDIFASTPLEFEVGYVFPYGQEKSITPYDTDKTRVKTSLKNIMQVIHMDGATIVVPLNARNLPIPGKKISWDEKRLHKDTSVWIRAHSFRIDFSPEQFDIEIFGVGGLS